MAQGDAERQIKLTLGRALRIVAIRGMLRRRLRRVRAKKRRSAA
jgi:hypothetical protein